MRFLADENCDFAVVRALRAAGHDVLAVSDLSPRADDPDIIELAVGHQRILLTEDKGFGQLVFAHGQRPHGVLFLRFPTAARHQIAEDVVRLVEREGDMLSECFTVVQPGKIRITRPRPPGPSRSPG